LSIPYTDFLPAPISVTTTFEV